VIGDSVVRIAITITITAGDGDGSRPDLRRIGEEIAAAAGWRGRLAPAELEELGRRFSDDLHRQIRNSVARNLEITSDDAQLFEI
jgi:hypothetical protein